MFSWFEKKICAFPSKPIHVMPNNFFSFLWAASKGVRSYILAIGFLSALIGAFEALLFAVLGKLVDWLSTIEPSRLFQKEGMALFLFSSVILGSIALVAIQTMLKHQTIWGNFPMRIRWNVHRLMLSQSMAFFQDEFAGRITGKILQTALAVRSVYIILLDIMLFVLIYFVTMIITVGHFEIILLIPFGCWIVLYIAILVWFIPKLSKAASAHADATSFMSGRITDAYSNITTIKLFSHSGRESEYAKGAMEEYLCAVNSMMRKMSTIEIVNHALSMLLILGASGTALWLWTIGQVGIGALASVAAMTLRMNGMAHWIAWETSQLFENIGTVQDGIAIFSRPIEITDKENAKELIVSKGDICFDHVNFTYKNGDPIIKDFCLSIRPGEKIGLVGRSGAGKSTLVNLLLRFHDVNSGSIKIDGQNITDVTQDSLRATIGMVTQETSLLHRSVKENLLYGKPDASEKDMIEAATQAQAHNFISSLYDVNGNKGYDVKVGERGVKLSGGQRQRIAIARIILKNAPILLLDEATSALDSEVEAAIQDNLYKLMQGKTVISIAHRLSTIAAMDRLIVIEQGKIVEQGTHTELLKKKGTYAMLWERQSGGFLGVDI